MSQRDEARQRRHNDRMKAVAAVITASAVGFALGVWFATGAARG